MLFFLLSLGNHPGSHLWCKLHDGDSYDWVVSDHHPGWICRGNSKSCLGPIELRKPPPPGSPRESSEDGSGQGSLEMQKDTLGRARKTPVKSQVERSWCLERWGQNQRPSTSITKPKVSIPTQISHLLIRKVCRRGLIEGLVTAQEGHTPQVGLLGHRKFRGIFRVGNSFEAHYTCRCQNYYFCENKICQIFFFIYLPRLLTLQEKINREA